LAERPARPKTVIPLRRKKYQTYNFQPTHVEVDSFQLTDGKKLFARRACSFALAKSAKAIKLSAHVCVRLRLI
jgi:hypothetical protein